MQANYSKILKSTLLIATIILLIPISIIFHAYITEWKPAEIEDVNYNSYTPSVIPNDTIKIISWNIGYGGLDSDMDFYMDGGEKCNTPEHKYRENIAAITDFLKENSDADFILLQEVDSLSDRTYSKMPLEQIKQSLPQYRDYFALNFSVRYIPQPISDPIGRVNSGLLTLSKYGALKAERISYPSFKKFPTRAFYLKRAVLELQIELKDGKKLSIFNTHNSAFDNGNARREEIALLRSILAKRNSYIVAGDWNSTPPNYTPSQAEVEDKFFSPVALKSDDLGENSRFIADYSGKKTARYNYEPYREGVTTTTLIDFAVYSNNITPLKCEIVDLGFKNSDHNPVIFKFTVK